MSTRNHSRALILISTLVIVAAACGGRGTVDPPGTTTSSTTSSTTTTTFVDQHCWPGISAGERHRIDLDGEGSTEVVYLRAVTADSYEIGVCADDELVSSLELTNREIHILGFVDLDDDGRSEILLQNPTGNGSLIQAATLTIRGLAMTDLAGELRMDGSEPPSEPFTADGFACDDSDEDGDLELLFVHYMPTGALLDGSGDDLVTIRVRTVYLDGLSAGEQGIDMYEIDYEAAYQLWLEPDRCAPGSATKVDIDYGENGWGRIDFDPAEFASDGNVVLTGIARGGTGNKYVVVGYEEASWMSDEFFPTHPVIWSSDDALHWQRSDLGDAVGGLRDVLARADGSGFVAVGATGSFTAAAWLSSDGINWSLVEVPSSRPGSGFVGPSMFQIIETPAGLVAVGSEDYAPDTVAAGYDTDAAVWLSTDGTFWERIEDPALGSPGYQPNSGAEFNGELRGVAYQSDVGIVAVGYAGEADPTIDYPVQWPAAWVSTDGRHWQRHHIAGEYRLTGVAAGPAGLVAYGVSTLNGSPDADAVVLLSTDGQRWVHATGQFDGLGEVDGIQSIFGAIAVPDVGMLGFGSDDKEFESLGGAAAWWSNADSGPASWERELHDDEVFEALNDPPTAVMLDAVWSEDGLVVAGFSGRTVQYPSGGSGCCLLGPALWVWSAD